MIHRRIKLSAEKEGSDPSYDMNAAFMLLERPWGIHVVSAELERAAGRNRQTRDRHGNAGAPRITPRSAPPAHDQQKHPGPARPTGKPVTSDVKGH